MQIPSSTSTFTPLPTEVSEQPVPSSPSSPSSKGPISLRPNQNEDSTERPSNVVEPADDQNPGSPIKDIGSPDASSASSGASSETSKSAGSTQKTNPPQLYLHLESANPKALSTFEEIPKCIYSGHLGEPPQNEAMTCDCRPQWVDGVNIACGPDSNCINRMTSIECTDDNCFCGPHCRNQRFQRREFAPVDAFLTEKKGFGLRAVVDIPRYAFVYEYIGEVIPEQKFRKRMCQYDEEGIKHFYFMMLQKGEYIDATKRGSLARFCNHSCNPNCYVDKWMVGDKLRMGIFSKRDILRGEELTFDYNVDRYGAQAQPCYCGEPCCVGYIGGKTQTEAQSKLPESVREALGLSEKENRESSFARKQRRKNAVDDLAQLVQQVKATPLTPESATKVVGVLLQTKDEALIRKLMERIFLTTDISVCRCIIALHGYNIFGTILNNFDFDHEFVLRCLITMQSWPRLTRNKIQDSNIEPVVKQVFQHTDNEEVKKAAENLLNEWASLELAYRIPRRKIISQPSQDENSKDSIAEIKLEDASSEKQENTPELDNNSPINYRSENENRNFSKFEKHNGYATHRGQYHKRPSLHKHRRISNSSSFSDNRNTNDEPDLTKNNTSATPKIDLKQIISAAMDSVNHKKLAKEQEEEKERLQQQKKEEKRKLAYEEAQKKHTKKQERKQTHKNEGTKSPNEHHLSSHSPAALAFKTLLAKFFANKTARFQEKLGKSEFKLRIKKMTEIMLKKHLQLVNSKKERALPAELSDSQQSKLKAWAFQYLNSVMERGGDHNSPSETPTTVESPLKRSNSATDETDSTKRIRSA
ncbi:histone lysine methyltransferase Set2 [Schizosaccharomyces cryophilus OY26]|uniref:Histone-lysine N-methyltransferase, H3 lysine-36 specific n=1 Tax=Schizosaccharomyces cryophilus (strain OY26 / ATCC MYA-4695 / CBS 11777 / NBRC 106824 / NRRL Y48691) TaxID=653667 RepID=S9VZQ1_SCHCR|nr:histone lysine methyltransferase Set2 [Schizosaccharomyces cryophilus OY26]EPY53148.1 histone lysine methyltransferase Set2 [Schizosaccharomyces cryophilus OY26]